MTLASYKQRLKGGRENFNDIESKLVQVAISKLRGKAVEALEGVDPKTVSELIDGLKTRFSPRRPFSYYQSRINHLCKFPEETAGEYGIKAQRYLRCATVALQNERPDTANNLTESLKTEIVIAFLRGLPTEFDALMKTKYKDLQEAINDAIIAERTIQDKEEVLADMEQERRYYQIAFNKNPQQREKYQSLNYRRYNDNGEDLHRRGTYFRNEDYPGPSREQEEEQN